MFLGDHGGGARSTGDSTKALEVAASHLPGSALGDLSRLAAEAHREAVSASEWSLPKGTEGGGEEEEDLPHAVSQATEGANDLASAAAALQAYARSPSPAALARYRNSLGSGREQWDEGISELWHLAHRSNPPTV